MLQASIDVDDHDERTERPFSLTDDISRLSGLVKSLNDCKLVIIDPISAYLGRTDSHKNAEVRAVLMPLADMADELNVAVLAITHLNKGGGSAMYRSIGSIAFTAAARAVWAVTKDRDDPDRRLVLPVKNNLAQDRLGMAYMRFRLASTRVTTLGNASYCAFRLLCAQSLEHPLAYQR